MTFIFREDGSNFRIVFSIANFPNARKLPGRVASDASRFTEEARGCEFFEGGFCPRAGGPKSFFLVKKKRDTKLQVGEVFDFIPTALKTITNITTEHL